MPRLFPERAFQSRMPRRKSARRALAMHPDLSVLRMPFLLHEVVADLINQLKLRAECLTKSLRHLLEDNQAIDDRVVAASRDRVQVVAVVTRVGREIAEVNIRDGVGLLSFRHLEIVCRQAVSEAARACVRLHEERLGLNGFLQLNKVISAAE